MKTYLSLALFSFGITAQAFPPAPAHEIYGIVRNESGRPLDTAEGTLILSGTTAEITRAPSDVTLADGTNYRLNVPMDSNILTGIYQISALRPTLPFSIRVVIHGVSYVPIQMQGNVWNIGQSGQRTRLDLTLGVDSDGDGIPDSWEQLLIDSDYTGKLLSLADIRAGDDLDGDGLSNLDEYLIGTYAMDGNDGLRLEVVGVSNGTAQLRFAIVSGRNYTIKSSSDLKTWQSASFIFAPGETAISSFRANDTTLVDAFVTVGTASTLSFRLHAD